ncbi:DUF2953 domain-containing protein [Ornithinibacillus sp. 179-J 7C1 HS]|uniref:DUF2953 domain-containing protein n=1 Tax=Ornithinibacillus sp. 179-J 7C1 HS TaxID=3142384 RepID=UPI0039A094AD
MLWIIIGSLLLILFFILITLKLKIRFYYRYQEEKHFIAVEVFYIRMRILHREMNLSEQSQNGYSNLTEVLQDMDKEDLKDFKERAFNILPQLKNAKKMLTIMMNSIIFHRLNWKTHFGLGDAASTGIAAGGIWMFKGTLLGFFYERSNLLCKPEISVTPHFQQKGLYSEIDCIVSISLGKAIHTSLRIVQNIKFYKKKEVYT